MQNEHGKLTINDWYHSYSQEVFFVVYMIVEDYQQAEDLTQDTFVKAYSNLDTFKQHSSPKTWLIKIARNLTIDYLRKRKPFLVIIDFFRNQQSKDPLPDTFMHINENNKELYQALSKLKRTYREVIILRKVKDFTIHETAEILNWSDDKVKVTLHRAMKDLKQILLEGGFIHETT